MNQSTSGPGVFSTNPYANHPSLSETEAEVLWQYAKLSQNIKEVILHSEFAEIPRAIEVVACALGDSAAACPGLVFD